MLTEIRDALVNSVPFMDIATGGVHLLSEIGVMNSKVSGAYDSELVILPCVVIRDTGLTRTPVQALNVHTAIYELEFRQDFAYGETRQMRRLAYDLLHDQYFTNSENPDDKGWQLQWDTDIPNTKDDVLDCSLEISRYTSVVERNASQALCA